MPHVPDPNDPVIITYPAADETAMIASLNSDVHSVILKTGGCITEHDINVRYREPAAGWTETVCVNQENVTATSTVSTQYTATFPLSALLNPVHDNEFCILELSGDIIVTGKSIAYDIDGTIYTGRIGFSSLSPSDNVEIEINSEAIVLYINYDEDPGTPPTVNVKLSTVTSNSSTDNASDPESYDVGR